MTLVIKKPTTSKLVMRKGWQPMDSDAATYIAAVEAADGQALEEKTKIAIDNFVLGCKNDGIWNAIKASCILAGARTLSGALVPLVGTAPTNVGPFVAGDYNRKTGLVGDAVNKRINTNRAGNADPQNSFHLSAYVATAATSGNGIFPVYIGTSGGNDRAIFRDQNNGLLLTKFNSGGSEGPSFAGASTGFIGITRTSSTLVFARAVASTSSASLNSATPQSNSIGVFGSLGVNLAVTRANCRLAFYSIGESLDLALLDARVTDLINAFATAIP